MFSVLTIQTWAQNSLLKNPTTGAPFSSGKIDNIEIISNEKDVALVAFNASTKAFYVLDIEDNDPDHASANTVTSITNLGTLVNGATGQTGLVLRDLQVNPISKSLYFLVTKGTTESYVVKIEEDGAKATAIDLSSITYSTVSWGGQAQIAVQDMTWGNGSLYITSGSNFSLDGEIAWMKAPFEHQTSTTNRATSMFKTNWGGTYFTNAPLEKLDFATINGEDRIMGVTLCAPGFSVKTSDLSGSGVLEVTEDFNIRYNTPTKVVHQSDGDKHWLFNLHGGRTLMRIGQKYIDGSQVKNNKHNANTVHLRNQVGNPTSGLTEDEIKIYPGVYQMIADWDSENLLVYTNNELKLMSTSDGNVGVDSKESGLMSIYPNPATDMLTLNFQEEISQGQLLISSVAGQEVWNEKVSGKSFQTDLSQLPSGTYLVKVLNQATDEIFTDKLTIVD